MSFRAMLCGLAVAGLMSMMGDCALAQEKPAAEVAKEQIGTAAPENVTHFQVTLKERSIEVEMEELMMPMRDGVRLYTVLIRPANQSKGPQVIMRTPYSGSNPDLKKFSQEIASSLDAGYGYVVQHCRGSGRSEGDCIPYLNERNDGLDLLAALRKHPFYNGEFFLTGGSYLSAVHLAYLKDKPADVKGAFLSVMEDNRYNIIYRNGLFKMGLHGSWYAKSMYKKKALRHKKNFSEEAWRILPLSNFSRSVFGEEAPLSEDMRHPNPEDPYWKTPQGGSEYYGALENLDIPVAIVTAWYDIFTEGIIDMWHRLSPERRARCPLLITPWSHGWNHGPKDFIISKEDGDVQGSKVILEWFEHIRKGTPMTFLPEGGVKWFNQFGTKWETGDDLPYGKKSLRLFLNQKRTLDTAPKPQGELTYTYIPVSPATFPGGCSNTFGGMVAQPQPNFRYDVLSFLTKPFEEPVQVCGQSELELHVRSDCPDTCFYARVSIVKDGVAYCLRDDICTISQFAPEYVPGQEVSLKMHFCENVLVFEKGTSLRLDISSSAWPHYVPHTNRRGLFCDQTGADTAHNTVLTGTSVLTLHID
ncbi:MAG: CocE/NonD family hydrolase [Victivallales bacterium]|nr:CocE/NonD family hydrolase [Victivallales bacterium]